ncbi:DUF4287 domain-containing protein [Dactylosporangium sp. CA-233914]|uniref:DUF4287 domain-containing protein n=1 Tax=Dactylosporangium sp. CA-233914 TaxID=3239934 RepID=UPI003D8D9D25
MSFQAYLDALETKTGKTPRELLTVAAERGFCSSAVKAGAVIEWLKDDYGVGRGQAMALVHVIRNGPKISSKHVGTTGTHRGERRLDGRATKPGV